MIQIRILLAWFFVVLIFAAGCGEVEQPRVNVLPIDAPMAVSSPYLEAALGEVLDDGPRPIPLAGPGMCPGHFDMRPSQLRDLARCGRLVRFDFQQALDAKFGQQWNGPKQTIIVRLQDGLCVPTSYVLACRQIADALVVGGVLDRRKADERLAQLERRMAALEKDVSHRIDAAGLRNAPVLCSGHQADFCRWLGLRVAAEMWSDAAVASNIEQSVKRAEAAQAKIVVANEPEGRRTADALADHLGARVVIFANFPSLDSPHPFDAMVRNNLTALLKP